MISEDELEEEEEEVISNNEESGDDSTTFFLMVALLFGALEIALVATIASFSIHVPNTKLLVGLTTNAKVGFYFNKIYTEGPELFPSAILITLTVMSLIQKVFSAIMIYIPNDTVVGLLGVRGFHIHTLISNSITLAVTLIFVLPVSGLGYVEHAFTGTLMVCACAAFFCSALARRLEATNDFTLRIIIPKFAFLFLGCCFFLYPIVAAYTSKNTLRWVGVDFSFINFWLSLPNVALIFHVTFLLPTILTAFLGRKWVSWVSFEVFHMTHHTIYLVVISAMVIYGSISTTTFDQTGQLKEIINQTLLSNEEL
jgi:hypothetical protein